MTTLLDWAPEEFELEFDDTRAYKFKDVEVIEEYGFGTTHKKWPGSHKNVHAWCVLANGYAVGWNENPGRGWSFPVIKMKD